MRLLTLLQIQTAKGETLRLLQLFSNAQAQRKYKAVSLSSSKTFTLAKFSIAKSDK